MIAVLLSALLQAASAPVAPPVPERFSILVDPCATQTKDGNEIVVCGGPAANSPRLPLPDERGPPDHAVASNPNLSAVRALDLSDTPCAARQGGCQVGFGPPIAPIAKFQINLSLKRVILSRDMLKG